MANSTLPNQPPHNTEAEQAVIGALIMDNDAIFKIDGKLRAEDFYDPVHATIYAAIHDLAKEGSPIDLLTLTNKLNDKTSVQAAGGSAYLAELPAGYYRFHRHAEPVFV